jgi:YfiH family protein
VNSDWLIPDWPAPRQVRAVCTTRAGGHSKPPFDALNLGDHVGDQPLAVAANRALLAQALGARPVFLSQVHGTRTLDVLDHSLDGTLADACITAQAGVACTVMVADCLPVLLTNASGTLVAAAHAGWRGLVGEGGLGILESVLERFKALAMVERTQVATELIAWLGPCIGPQAFEVGEDVRHAFVTHDPEAQTLFTPATPGMVAGTAGTAGKWRADLAGLARQRLAALGISQVYGNDSSPRWCTVGNPSRFFSYRRDGVTGRLGASIWLA